MKRYRILPFFDFDTRANFLSIQILEEWEEDVKALHRKNRQQIYTSLINEFGEKNSEQKIKNFIDLGSKLPSIIAFHNTFFTQVRVSFVVGSYYACLVGACALGERILNHLILSLREHFSSTAEYRRVFRKDSFDNWTLAINTLVAWEILLPAAAEDFQDLMCKRNESIHFRPDTDRNVRQLALDAVICLGNIINEQFSGFGPQPWFISGIPGEIYIKKEWEAKPYINKIYLPNGKLVGPFHRIESMHPINILEHDYDQGHQEISDDEFIRLRIEFNNNGQNI